MAQRGRRAVRRGVATRSSGFDAVIARYAPYRWWDASTGVAVTGGLVDSWTDRVAGEAASQTLTLRPAYTAAHASWNNLPAVSGTGTQFLQNLASSSSAHWDGTNTPRTMYTVARRSTLGDGSTLEVSWAYSGTNSTNQYGMGARGAAGVANNLSIEINATTNQSAANIATANFVQTSTYDASSNNNMWENGTQTLTNQVNAAPTGSQLQVVTMLGRHYNALDPPPFGWVGEVVQIIMYDGVHSAATRSAIEGAIRRKYNF